MTRTGQYRFIDCELTGYGNVFSLTRNVCPRKISRSGILLGSRSEYKFRNEEEYSSFYKATKEKKMTEVVLLDRSNLLSLRLGGQ